MDRKYDDIVIAVRAHEDGAESRLPLGLVYGRNGGCTAYQAFSGDRLGRANGGGYDLRGTVVSDVLTKVWGMPRFNGAAGFGSLQTHAEAHGIRVFSFGEAVWALPVPAAVAG